MKIIYEEQFKNGLKEIIKYISQDKPNASTLFKKELKSKFELLLNNPKMYRISIYFNNPAYRDMVYKGYTIIYKIENHTIKVLDIFKWVDKS